MDIRSCALGMPGRPRRSSGRSPVTPRARKILARTAAARRARDAYIAGVELDGGPPELGPKRRTSVPTWLTRDLAERERVHGRPRRRSRAVAGRRESARRAA